METVFALYKTSMPILDAICGTSDKNSCDHAWPCATLPYKGQNPAQKCQYRSTCNVLQNISTVAHRISKVHILIIVDLSDGCLERLVNSVPQEAAVVSGSKAECAPRLCFATSRRSPSWVSWSLGRQADRVNFRLINRKAERDNVGITR